MKSSSSKQILSNPFVLYFVLALALGDLLYLSVAGNFMFVAIFMLIGFLTSFFSKNMIVILVVAMAATNIVQFGIKGNISEGLENEEEDDEEEAFTDPETKPSAETEPSSETETKPSTDTDKKSDVTETASETVDKVMEQQKELVDKVKKLEPMMKQVESFVDRLDRFAQYTP